jgi:hypothetical protein
MSRDIVRHHFVVLCKYPLRSIYTKHEFCVIMHHDTIRPKLGSILNVSHFVICRRTAQIFFTVNRPLKKLSYTEVTSISILTFFVKIKTVQTHVNVYTIDRNLPPNTCGMGPRGAVRSNLTLFVHN